MAIPAGHRVGAMLPGSSLGRPWAWCVDSGMNGSWMALWSLCCRVRFPVPSSCSIRRFHCRWPRPWRQRHAFWVSWPIARRWRPIFPACSSAASRLCWCNRVIGCSVSIIVPTPSRLMLAMPLRAGHGAFSWVMGLASRTGPVLPPCGTGIGIFSCRMCVRPLPWSNH